MQNARLNGFDFGLLFVEWQAVGELGRLQHSRHAVDRLERLDLVAAVRRLKLLELARLDEHVAFERADGFVVGLEARLEARAERGEACRQRAYGGVAQPAVPA